MCAKIKPVDILLQCDYCSPRSPNFNVGAEHGPIDFTQTGFYFALPLRSMASVIFNIEIGGVGGTYFSYFVPQALFLHTPESDNRMQCFLCCLGFLADATV